MKKYNKDTFMVAANRIASRKDNYCCLALEFVGDSLKEELLFKKMHRPRNTDLFLWTLFNDDEEKALGLSRCRMVRAQLLREIPLNLEAQGYMEEECKRK